MGEKRSRWTLASLQRHCSWLEPLTRAAICRLLHRLHISCKLAREYIHSPDLDYEQKLAAVRAILQISLDPRSQCVVLFIDQMGYYRQPRVGTAWEEQGHRQALARRSYRSDCGYRVVGALHPFSGQVLYRQASHIRIPTLVDFYQTIVATYATAQTIYLVMDNWPIHFHPDVLAALQPQQFAWPMHRPRNWPTEPSKKARRLNLPIQMVPLPTYAPWTNPIEKLWRKLKQEVLCLHHRADRWEDLRTQVAEFLDAFHEGSPQLLRYVGLTERSRLYGDIVKQASRSPKITEVNC